MTDPPPGDPAHDTLEATVEVLALEWELRSTSLDLWAAGWEPQELLDEVRFVVGTDDAVTFMAHAMLVDDAHRSSQSRPTAWDDAMEALRSVHGPVDPAPGWLIRWARSQSSSVDAAHVAWDVTCALRELTPLPPSG